MGKKTYKFHYGHAPNAWNGFHEKISSVRFMAVRRKVVGRKDTFLPVVSDDELYTCREVLCQYLLEDSAKLPAYRHYLLVRFPEISNDVIDKTVRFVADLEKQLGINKKVSVSKIDIYCRKKELDQKKSPFRLFSLSKAWTRSTFRYSVLLMAIRASWLRHSYNKRVGRKERVTPEKIFSGKPLGADGKKMYRHREHTVKYLPDLELGKIKKFIKEEEKEYKKKLKEMIRADSRYHDTNMYMGIHSVFRGQFDKRYKMMKREGY